MANKVAEALGREFLLYDASKAMFEDVLSYPNVEKLRHGVVEYVPSPLTIWDKGKRSRDSLVQPCNTEYSRETPGTLYRRLPAGIPERCRLEAGGTELSPGISTEQVR